ncbi:MAG: flagellin [Janthinobacterium lividum]
MAQIISNNTASLVAQNNLNKASSTYSTAINQLSSGKKVSSAADNSAALAISGRMQSQINGNTQAISNANDGIALAQTADSAFSQITSNLQQIRTLAVQSANSTYSASDRASLNQQAQQLLSQVNTIANQTQYNGQTLLDGSFGSATFQTGANAGQSTTVNLSQGVRTSQMGQTAAQTFSLASINKGVVAAAGDGLSNASASKALSVQLGDGPAKTIGQAVAGAEAGQDANSAYAAVAAINGANIAGLTATASNVQTFTTANEKPSASADNVVNLKINGTSIFGDGGMTVAKGTSVSTGDLVNQINSVAGTTGVSASLDDGGSLKLSSTDGRNITISQTSTSASGGNGDYKLLQGGSSNVADPASTTQFTADSAVETNGATGAGGKATMLQGTLSLSSSKEIKLSGAGDANLYTESANGNTTAGNGKSSTISLNTQTTLASLSLKTAASSTAALQSLDSALATVSTLQGAVGAIQNRFDSTISNLNAITQNAKSAQSSITDADYASVASTLSTADVLQQSGVAMVSKANQIPNQILKLVTG